MVSAGKSFEFLLSRKSRSRIHGPIGPEPNIFKDLGLNSKVSIHGFHSGYSFEFLISQDNFFQICNQIDSFFELCTKILWTLYFTYIPVRFKIFRYSWPKKLKIETIKIKISKPFFELFEKCFIFVKTKNSTVLYTLDSDNQLWPILIKMYFDRHGAN